MLSIASLCWAASVSPAAEPDTGSFTTNHLSLELTHQQSQEFQAPLFNYRHDTNGLSWAFSPILSYTNDPGTDSSEFDFAYPILTYDRFGAEYRFQILQIFSFSGGQSQKDEATKRFTLFPFYFQQRSSNPEQNYTGVMPFYGHLKNRLFRDDIRWVMLPLYVETRKKDVVTDNYLLPFFDLRHGDGLHGWQFWPVVGFEHKDITTKTNGFDEVETVGGHDKMFVLWPFFFKNQTGVGTTNLQNQLAVLPFYTRQHSALRDSATYLWPLGYTKTEDREKKYKEWDMPWPLVVFARGEGKYANRIWPLFSHAKNPILESDFYLWPIYKYNRATADPLDRQRTRILFFLYSDLIEKNTATGTALHRTDMWPLFTARKVHDGSESLQVLSILEPLLPNSKSISRNYSPLWALWTCERNPKAGTERKSLLWNIYRQEKDPKSKKCSILFGLFKYHSGPDGKSWRILNIPIARTSKADATPSSKQ